MQQPILFVVLAVGALFATLLALAGLFFLARPWLQAALHGTPVSLVHVLAMRLRGNPPGLLIDAYIVLRSSGVDATIDDVEKAYIAHKNRQMTRGDLVELVKQTEDAK